MTLNPALTDDVTVHTKRKDGTLYVLVVDDRWPLGRRRPRAHFSRGVAR
jgi:hypothetical protein